MDPRNLPAKVPWLTAEGYFDPAQFPMDGVLKQAISPDEKQFRSGVTMLQSMYHHGRAEAGVFLLGLLLAADDNWERRIAIVEALKSVETKACADLLFGELKRLKSSNTTRRYLTTIIKVLAQMPSELVLDGFATLAQACSQGRLWPLLSAVSGSTRGHKLWIRPAFRTEPSLDEGQQHDSSGRIGGWRGARRGRLLRGAASSESCAEDPRGSGFRDRKLRAVHEAGEQKDQEPDDGPAGVAA